MELVVQRVCAFNFLFCKYRQIAWTKTEMYDSPYFPISLSMLGIIQLYNFC